MPREPQKSRLLFVSALLSVFGGLIVVFGQNPPVDAGRALPLRESELIAQGRPLPDFDVRRNSGAAPADLQRLSAADLQQRLGPDTLVQFDAQSGGVSQIFQAGGYLTDAQAGGAICHPERISRRARGRLWALASRDLQLYDDGRRPGWCERRHPHVPRAARGGVARLRQRGQRAC